MCYDCRLLTLQTTLWTLKLVTGLLVLVMHGISPGVMQHIPDIGRKVLTLKSSSGQVIVAYVQYIDTL